MPDESTATAECPACQGRLYPRELRCVDCGLHVKTAYADDNEFAGLADDALHLLRIFVACDGRIRDMESALGVSYPTVKSRLGALKTLLGLDVEMQTEEPPLEEKPAPPKTPARPKTPAEVLDRLDDGEIDYDEAMRLLKEI